jgi:predicted acyl esterase
VSDFTLLGEPGLKLTAAVAGVDAEVNSRLWDIAPDGAATLVTRGAYRWNSGDSINYALQGNGWVFYKGHQIRIQVTQNDAPYLRLDNYASAINYSFMELTLPTPA